MTKRRHITYPLGTPALCGRLCALPAAAALLLAASSCQRAEQPQEGPSTVQFSVSESVQDFRTKGRPVSNPSGGALLLRSADGRTLSLVMSDEPASSGPATRAPGIYGSAASATQLDGVSIAAWGYSLTSSAGEDGTGWSVDAGMPSGGKPVRASKNGTVWKPASDIFFNSGKLAASYRSRWYALAPWEAYYGTTGSDGAVSGLVLADASLPAPQYTVPASVAQQWDLLAAVSATRGINEKEEIGLTFSHVLAGVRFKRAKDLPIQGITLSGVYDQATLRMVRLPADGDLSTFTDVDGADAAGTDLWDARARVTPARTYTLDTASDGSWHNGNPADRSQETQFDYIDTLQTLMMIPQLTPAGAKITVTVDGTAFEGDISGHRWLPGRLVTYRIDEGGELYVLEPSTDVLSVSYSGGLKDLGVKSYKMTPSGGSIEYSGVDWKLQMKKSGAWTDVHSVADILDESGNPWINSMPLGGVHSDLQGETQAKTERSYGLDVRALACEISPNEHTRRLRGFPPVGTKDAPVDLSLLSMPEGAETALKTRTAIARSTANCYVVDRPGWYKIPMVYGNAIKDGADNPSAYKYTEYYTSGLTQEQQFKTDHTIDGVINQPWVSEKYTVDYARLLWQDIPGLVSEIEATGSGKGERYITFYVDPATIHQGNAVIAAYTSEGLESGDTGPVVAWSWHIWVTDAPFSAVWTKVVREDNGSYTQPGGYQGVYGLMRQDIGSVDGIERRDWDRERSGEFRLVQVEGGVEVGVPREVKLLQKGATTADYDDRDWSYGKYAMSYQWGRKDPYMRNQNDGRKVAPLEFAYFTNKGSGSRMYAYDGRICDYWSASGGRWVTSGTVLYYQLIKDPLLLSNTPDVTGFLLADRHNWDNSDDLGLYGNTVPYSSVYYRRFIPVKTVYDPSPLGWCVPPPGMVRGVQAELWDLRLVASDVSIAHLKLANAKDEIDFYPYYSTGVGAGTPQPRWCCSLIVASTGRWINAVHMSVSTSEAYTPGPDNGVFSLATASSGNDYGRNDNHPFNQYAVRPCLEKSPSLNEGYINDNTEWF